MINKKLSFVSVLLSLILLFGCSNQISNPKASKAISPTIEIAQETTKEPTTTNEEETSKGSFAGSAIVTIIVIVAIVVIGFALIRGKKR